ESLRPGWQMLMLSYRTQGFHLLYPYPRADLEALRDEIARWDSTRARLVDSQNLFEGKQAIVQAYLLGLTSWRLEEEEAIEVHVAELDRWDAAQPDDSLAYSLARTLEGLLAWQRGETDRALDALDAAWLRFPDWTFSLGFHDEPLVRYLRAEILYEAERYEEALAWYASLDDGGTPEEARTGVFYLGPSYLRRAQIYEQLGDEERAVDFYTRFIELWKECDPELQPQVEAAQERLDRLLDGAVREPGDIVRPGASSQ
ncbi:MAG: tol-pal system YbgF family protein, partial [Rhodothermales bacterium]